MRGLNSVLEGKRDNYGKYYAVYGEHKGKGYVNYGVYGYVHTSAADNGSIYGSNYGVYGRAEGGSTNYGVYSNGQAGGTTAWANNSDARLKKDVQQLTGALDKVLKLRGVTYYWKNKEEMAAAKGVPSDSLDYGYDNKKHIGVIAQELEAEYPELIHTDGDGFKSVEYSTLTPILIEAVKELKAEKDELKAEKDALEAKVEKLEAQMREILEKLK